MSDDVLTITIHRRPSGMRLVKAESATLNDVREVGTMYGETNSHVDKIITEWNYERLTEREQRLAALRILQLIDTPVAREAIVQLFDHRGGCVEDYLQPPKETP